jgi:hypothetical protein
VGRFDPWTRILVGPVVFIGPERAGCIVAVLPGRGLVRGGITRLAARHEAAEVNVPERGWIGCWGALYPTNGRG